MITVAEAISTAKKWIREVYEDEKISNLGLEEIKQDPHTGAWSVTIGFSRPWQIGGAFHTLALGRQEFTARSMKIVNIDQNGTIMGVEHREVT